MRAPRRISFPCEATRGRHPRDLEQRSQGLLGATFPHHGIAGERVRRPVLDYGLCTTCFMALPATGQCDNCD